jgi:hypothetical protein
VPTKSKRKPDINARYCCPRCRGTDQLAVTVLCWARLDQHDPTNIETDIDTSDQEWDDNSMMRCGDCDHTGKAWAFAGVIATSQTPVADVLRARGIRMYGMATRLDSILAYLKPDESRAPGRVLLVGDLAGVTYDDLFFGARNLGHTTLRSLVDAELIPPMDPDGLAAHN